MHQLNIKMSRMYTINIHTSKQIKTIVKHRYKGEHNDGWNIILALKNICLADKINSKILFIVEELK